MGLAQTYWSSLTAAVITASMGAFTACSSAPFSGRSVEANPQTTPTPDRQTASKKPEITTVIRKHASQPTPEQIEEARKNADLAWRNNLASAEYHFSLAQAYSAEGNSDRAIEEYKLTLLFDPDSALIHARLAAEYVKKGMLSAAMESCKEALKRDPNYTDARLMLAGLYSASNEQENALEEYAKILKKKPSSEEALIYRSQILLELDRSQQAISELKGFVARNPESALAWYYLGRAHQRRDESGYAASAYRKAMLARPGFAQAGLALGYLYETQKKEKDAIRTYQDVYDETQDAVAATRLATLYLKKEQYKKAIPYLDSLRAQDPEDLNIRVKLGLVFLELKEYAKAEEEFKFILSKNPSSDRVHFYLGSLHEQRKEYESAIESLKRISPESSLYKDAVLHVTYLLKHLNRLDEARDYIANRIEKTPNFPAFYIFQASVSEDLKETAEAIKTLSRGVERFPEHEKLRYYLGSLHDKTGDAEKALVQMEAILNINPDNVDALNYIGYTWTNQGVRLDDAEKLLRKALRLRPDNGYVQDSWGWHLFVRGRVDEAVVELEKAVKLSPKEAVILEHLGDAYARRNLQEKALEIYARAVQHAEDAALKDKLQKKIDNIQGAIARRRSGQSDESQRVPAANK